MKKIFLHLSLNAALIFGVSVYCFSQTIPRTAVMPDTAKLPAAPVNVIPNSPTICDFADVRIFPSANPQSEIHLSINKINPSVLLLSSQTDFINNSVQGAYWSTNAGVTWTGSDNLPNGAFGRGDPSTAFDAAGRGYIATMNAPTLTGNPNGYLIQKTLNNGTSWVPQVQGTGIINNFDKDMIAADDIAGSSYANNLYCAWSVLNATPTTNLVQFNRSTNQAVSFSVPITLKTGWGQGTNVQTGPNGEVYVCWADYNNSYADWTSKGLGFCRSTNGGVNFTTAQRVITYTGTRTYNPVTNDDENPLFNGIRVNDFPSMAVDKSNGSHHGRIYVVLPVKENGNGKAVIQLSFSDN